MKEALTHYQHALLANVGAFTLEAYIHLAKCFVEMKDWQSACDVYLEGCAHHPCVSLWLGAGISFMRLGDAENGELALSEANILDNRHAVVWGYLALMSLKAGRSEEAKLVMFMQLTRLCCDIILLSKCEMVCNIHKLHHRCPVTKNMYM